MLGAVLELRVVFVVIIIVGLIRRVIHVFTMGRQDTLGENVVISFMVARVHLSLILELLGQVFALNSLMVFEGRVLRRGMYLRVELSLLRVEEEVVIVVDH